MRLTIDLLQRIAEQRTNCLGEREILLNGYGIPAIENTAAIITSSSTSSSSSRNDSNHNSNNIEIDTLNICNNLLLRLDNFCQWYRLSNIMACHNRIESIDGKPHYRLYTIHNIPTLRCLDYTRIKRDERKRATKFAKSSVGITLINNITQQQQQSDNTTTTTLSQSDVNVKTFTPGVSMDGNTIITLFTNDEKEAIRQLLANASSIHEVEAIESAVQRGILPEPLQQLSLLQQQQPSSQKRSNTDNEDSNNNNINHTEDSEPAQKRLKGT